MNRPRPLPVAILAVIARVERVVTFSAFMILVVILFGDVLSRELTGAGLTWARDLGVLANFVLTMVGIGIASSEGAHLRPRFADRWLPRDWEPALDALREGLMAAFCLAFAVVASVAVYETAILDEHLPVLRWPTWPFQLLIPVVFLIAALRHSLLGAYPQLRGGTRASGADSAAVARQPGTDN